MYMYVYIYMYVYMYIYIHMCVSTSPEHLQGACLGMGVHRALLYKRKLSQPKDHLLRQFVATKGSVFA